MPDRTQDIKNLRAVATACKNYTDNKINDLQWQLGTYDLGVESDNTSALIKTMPSGTIKANVNKIYGASKVSENLANVTNFNYRLSNSTGILVESTGYNTTDYIEVIEGANYSTNIETYSTTNYASISYYDNNKTFVSSIRADNDAKSIAIPSGVKYLRASYRLSLQDNIMINRGSTALPYEPHFEGIHNLELSGLKVEGANIFTGTWVAQTNAQIVSSTNESLKVNRTQISNSFAYKTISLKAGTYTLSFNSDGYCTYQISTESVVLSITGNVSKTFTISEDTQVTFNFTTSNNNTQINITNIMLNYGSTALAYVPYIAPTTKTIDLTSIEDSGGNKLFADGSLKGLGNIADEITPNKAYKDIGVVKLKDCSIVYDSETQRFIITIPNIEEGPGRTIPLIILGYDIKTNGETFDINWNMVAYNGLNQAAILLHNHTYTLVSDLKANEGEKYIYFPLKTPIEADIDFSFLKNIQGHSNGSITAQNTYDMPVQSDIDYLFEEVKA